MNKKTPFVKFPSRKSASLLAHTQCIKQEVRTPARLAAAEEHDAWHSRRHSAQQRLDRQLRHAVRVRHGAFCACAPPVCWLLDARHSVTKACNERSRELQASSHVPERMLAACTRMRSLEQEPQSTQKCDLQSWRGTPRPRDDESSPWLHQEHPRNSCCLPTLHMAEQAGAERHVMTP